MGARDWAAVADHVSVEAQRFGRLRVEPASTRSILTALVLQWAIGVAVVGTFFFAGSRGHQPPGLPMWLCYAFPAVAFGVGQAIRGLKLLR